MSTNTLVLGIARDYPWPEGTDTFSIYYKVIKSTLDFKVYIAPLFIYTYSLFYHWHMGWFIKVQNEYLWNDKCYLRNLKLQQQHTGLRQKSIFSSFISRRPIPRTLVFTTCCLFQSAFGLSFAQKKSTWMSLVYPVFHTVVKGIIF